MKNKRKDKFLSESKNLTKVDVSQLETIQQMKEICFPKPKKEESSS